ncbi:MAG TPA: bifunctional DNA-formamidopyrimidine glycosylase/DNA-(apurinic or apyrimidinic site) lyase [Oligoflexia bacterium]|nr:bifunctional DNA-formamidopyrimidine glycosylase/DNA-(apurinic or apyrimidinic site) lyase [Oligoflexia bacterium]HMR24224.1 bifunctional DNA-formamidopyrimidine glycosylase/DNA-(apurinic or apyrimidinic site) lyase [Oligoflexia bacterium]
MPELPEVETVCQGLAQLIKPQSCVEHIHIYTDKLRFPISKTVKDTLPGQKLQRFSRRAKYILWHFDQHIMISHLGMTGSWRELNDDMKKHDHFAIAFVDEQTLIYNDPRRFGFIDLCPKDIILDHKFLKHLGPEPLSDQFNHNYLQNYCKNKTAAIKSVIMDQRCVVGVGNIYACESLFQSEIHPLTPAKDVSELNLKKLIKHIQNVLLQAIEAGGSTIKDFKKAGGEQGYFQHQFLVYGKTGELCPNCKQSKIENLRISGRSSFYCPNCQIG